jgi:2-aminoadipate transaminase
MQPGLPISERISRLTSSLVREILAAAQAPGMVSFAGGLPSLEAMPILPKSLNGYDWQDPVFQQYGTTEGEPYLRNQLARYLADTGLVLSPDQILILSGSQQGIDLSAKLFVDPGTNLLCEAPTYLAALQAFQLFGAKCIGLALNTDGINIEDLVRNIETHRPSAIYLIPSFQNPSGTCYSLQTRQAIAEVLDHYQLPIIEDEPYRELMYDHVDRTPICSLVKKAPWIYLGSFSKTLWPGWRVGFLAASLDLFPYLVRLKQAGDLHTNRPGQICVANWLAGSTKTEDLRRLREVYKQKRDAMQNALTQHFSDIATWKTPAGGLFFWLALHQTLDTRPLLQEAMKLGIAYMPGEAFYSTTSEPQLGKLRLNFSHASESDMQQGLEILARLFRSQ